tara:strand:- start:702 stop:1331 length:630 start_codon:yes stop_codon:yes gene_type:complete
MTPQKLIECSKSIADRHAFLVRIIDELDPASPDIESDDFKSDAFAEGIFLRAFTAYENDIEKLFLHYVTGGATLKGAIARTYLSIQDEGHARRLTKAGFRFLNWSRPNDIKNTAENYIENGWPIVDMMAAKAQDLADCERVRNRIAHSSDEAIQKFNTVQRNLLSTERLFTITPGQFLRIRNLRLKKLHIRHYVDVMNEMLIAIQDPPP